MLVGLTGASSAGGSGRRRPVLSWSTYLCLALLTCDVLHLCSSISPVHALEEDDSSSSAKSNDYSMANLLPSFKSFLFWRNGDPEPKPMDEELTLAEKVTYEVNTDDEMPALLRPDPGISSLAPSKHWNSHRSKILSTTKNNRICHSCAKESFMDVDEEYRQRIEYIKEQILSKLGLSEPPQLHQMPDIDYSLYMRIAENSILQKQDDITTDHDSSEGVERALILPKKRSPRSPEFDLSTVNINGDNLIKSITVLVKYNLSDNYHTSMDETDLVVTGVLAENDEEEQSDFGLLSSVNVVKQSAGKVENNFDSGHWFQYDVTNLLTDYYGMIRIYNENFDILRSVIMIEMSRHKFIRAKRSLDCTDRVSFCCRQPFFVNFTTIGWNNWILFPPGYNANYCRGKCDLSHARYHHTTVIGKYPVIKLCCSPREMSAISLIYMDKQSTIYHKVLDHMVVESCDCA